MSYIFDAAVTLAEIDPNGIGGLAMAGVSHVDVNAGDVTYPIARGDVIDGEYLYPTGTAFRGDASGLYADNCTSATALPGRWLCLGHLDEMPNTNYNLDLVFTASLWLRVE